MEINNRPWCDFIVYTLKGLTVSRIEFDSEYWTGALPNLVFLYDNCVAPEIISPVHMLGIPMHHFCHN